MRDFLSIENNDMFSEYRGLDLQDLIVQIENMFLTYRKSLNLEKNVTFGIEIEYENVFRNVVAKFIAQNYDSWTSHSDASLNSGGEITSPILTDIPKTWNELKGICCFLKEKNADTLHNAGGHVHVGAHVLGLNINSWKSFLKTYMVYENVLFRFLYGDKISARSKIEHYAPPIAGDLLIYIKELEKLKNILNVREFFEKYARYKAVNFQNLKYSEIYRKDIKNTLEFRATNATTEEVIWQNNINAITKLLNKAAKNLIDMDYINYKINNFNQNYGLVYYNEINLMAALEFVDLIFDNNLDKAYFLRQYFKGFEDNFGYKNAVRAKTFYR